MSRSTTDRDTRLFSRPGFRSTPNRGLFPRGWICLIALISSAIGCGGTLYTLEIATAERAFEQARTESAKTYAPYEFHYAEVHLHKAHQEASEAAYEDAIRYAKIAEQYSHRARVIASRKRTAASP